MSRRILLLEDSRSSAAPVIRACTGLGWEIVHVENGLEALRAMAGPTAFDALVVDFNLPAFQEKTHPLSMLERIPRTYLFEGDSFLAVARCMTERCPKIIVAFSGIPGNNDWLMKAGAIGRIEGKDADGLTRMLAGMFSEST